MSLFTKINTKRGSLAIEVAILLPLFVVGILTLGYLTKASLTEENVMNSFVDETHNLAANALRLPSLSAYKNDVVDRISEENNGVVADIGFEELSYRFLSNEEISAEISYSVPLRIPHIFKDEVLVRNKVLCRAFVGAKPHNAVVSFDEMETDDDSAFVYVFPRAGERYHTEDCTYIKNEPLQVLLSSGIRNKYSPCSLCNPGSLSNGSLVYCFTYSGHAYHSESCYIVERFVIKMSDKDAISKGYTPCQKCGGRK
jgi:hypothetical protein